MGRGVKARLEYDPWENVDMHIDSHVVDRLVREHLSPEERECLIFMTQDLLPGFVENWSALHRKVRAGLGPEVGSHRWRDVVKEFRSAVGKLVDLNAIPEARMKELTGLSYSDHKAGRQW